MITISNRQRTRKLNLQLLKEIIAAALEELEIKQAELGIVLTGPKEMASINEDFLGHEGPTDVITFDYQCSESGIQNPEMHGEVFVCVEVAEKQAKEFKTSRQSEVVRYIVHGILHLMGHDDMQPAARKKMKREEGRLVRKLSRSFALSKL
ncbi:MAG TPA: rRNA maturation RNase YbeY [Pseudomonadales bacterium]|nr:rRNA maturation RNase YbeY [Pseudomonadales bacterium]